MHSAWVYECQSVIYDFAYIIYDTMSYMPDLACILYGTMYHTMSYVIYGRFGMHTQTGSSEHACCITNREHIYIGGS